MFALTKLTGLFIAEAYSVARRNIILPDQQ